MRKKISKAEWVRNRLIKYGYVSRNQCLKKYITRLSDIIFRLTKKGWKFERVIVTNPSYNYGVDMPGDFKYVATKVGL